MHHHQSPFERLPAELRNHIYEYALYEPSGAKIWNEPSLLYTCKSIRAEAELMYYAINHFTIDIHEERIGHDLCRWLKTKAGPRTRLIRSLSIHVQMPSLMEQPNVLTDLDNDDDDEFEDCGSIGFMQLLHVMESVRKASFSQEPVEKVVSFTVNGARDDEKFDKIETMSSTDQERYRGAKFLLLSLVHGEANTIAALEAEDCEEQLEALDMVIRERRAS